KAVQVSVLAMVGDNDQHSIQAMLEDLRGQRGVRAELIVIDRTRDGTLRADGARVVRPESIGNGDAWRSALIESSAEFVAWLQPGCRLLPTHLSNGLAALDARSQALMATCDYYLHDDEGQYIGRSDPSQMGEAPGPGWENGVIMRRAALDGMAKTAFHPVELKLWQDLRAEGQITHVQEPGFSIAEERYRRDWDRSRTDSALLAFAMRPFDERTPRLTVSICTSGTVEEWSPCLEAYSRQLLSPGTFELVLVTNGATVETRAQLESIEFPIPTRILHQEQACLAAARNTGIEAARGRLILFGNENTIPAEECVQEHLTAHACLMTGVQAAVLGSVEAPSRSTRNAFAGYLQNAGNSVENQERQPHAFQPMEHFETGNVSIDRRGALRVGGFDAEFGVGGCEDMDFALRLKPLGYAVLHVPSARAHDSSVTDFDGYRARRLARAQGEVRLFHKHPQLMASRGAQATNAVDCHQHTSESLCQTAADENAARELSRIDVDLIEPLGPEYMEAKQGVVERLSTLMQSLERTWTLRGYLHGFREQRLAEFQGLTHSNSDSGQTICRGSLEASDELAASSLDVPIRSEPCLELSIIVPTCNRLRELMQLLDKLAEQDIAADRFEVIVVDDASTQPVQQPVAAAEWPFALRVLTQSASGPGAARNLGMQAARGSLIVFFNDDAVPARNNLRRHLEAHRSRSEDVVVMGTFSQLPQLQQDSFARHVESSSILFGQPLMQSGLLYRGLSLCTGNLSISKVLLEGMGGFDEAFVYAGGEDSELGFRLERDRGVKVLFDDSIRCEHDHALNVEGYLNRMRVIGWANYLIESKHGQTGLLDGAPTDAQGWNALEQEVQSEQGRIRELLDLATDFCARERAAAQSGPVSDDFRKLCEEIGNLGFRWGIVAAHNGRLPCARQPSMLCSGGASATP
ncbi:MAG: glycosyltransferase involved in cell wall biosynthesis, partial [Candidatus Paceibacteria bacterium]